MEPGSSTLKLRDSLELPCGATLPNRFGKSAMSEILGTYNHSPSDQLSTLYNRWAQGGTGLLITGNVMVDPSALGEPKNVVIEDERDLPKLKEWAHSRLNSHLWVQLNHPGKQSPSFLSSKPVAPSAVPLSGALAKAFNTPKALSDTQIQDIIARFANAARITKKAGFTGVQIHGAHGYLVSQFLSGKHNIRTDKWGGSLENRMRFLIEVFRAIRKEVGESFPVGVKLNSSDFHKDSFDEQSSMEVIKTLEQEGCDLLEVSGGNYEKPVMMGKENSREVYFAKFCQTLRKNTDIPVMLTGGFRSANVMEQALKDDLCEVVGLARPLTIDPDIPAKIFAGNMDYKSDVKHLTTGVRKLDRIAMLNITWYEQQIGLLSKGKRPQPNLHPLMSMVRSTVGLGFDAFRARRV